MIIIMHRPMDLQTIKKSMENGLLRTTADFQRDVMLMFLNAKMYNTDEHIIQMTDDMFRDAMETIEV